jgi:hypothetical protein
MSSENENQGDGADQNELNLTCAWGMGMLNHSEKLRI